MAFSINPFNIFSKTDGNDLEAVLLAEKKKKEQESQGGNFLSQFMPDSIMPEDPDKRSALARALLMGGANMMGAGGPSLDPRSGNFLAGVGAGLAGGAKGYDDYLAGQSELTKTNMANQAQKVKFQAVADAQKRNAALMAEIGTPGQFGYSIEQLGKIMQTQLANGDEEGARETQKQIQALQIEGAKNGMIQGQEGLQAAPGYNETLAQTERYKAGGRVAGEEAYKQTDDIREYNLYVDQAKAAGISPKSFNDWQIELKQAGSSKVNVNTGDSADAAYGKKAAEKQAETHAALTADYGPATTDLANVQELRYALKDNPGGLVSGLQSMASKYGIKLGKNAGKVEYAQATINKLIPTQRPAGSGSMSDKDVEMFRASLPQLMNTAEGNNLILNTMEALAQYRVEQAKIAAKGQNGELSREEVQKQLMSLPDPMEGYRSFRDGGTIVEVKSQSQFESLPSGTRFKLPNGFTGVKP